MRILLAGTSSGCGKTTASLLLMAALRERGLDVAPCKVGPDYIDTGFHELVCGRPSHNLDSFLIEPRDLPTLLSRPADITVIEGVMGYYDGMDATSCRQSTWEMARLTRTPVLLVVDASGSAASAAATVKGFMTLREDSGIAGVLESGALIDHCSVSGGDQTFSINSGKQFVWMLTAFGLGGAIVFVISPNLWEGGAGLFYVFVIGLLPL